jgi:hypothetical protein
MTQLMTREQWMMEAIAVVRPAFEEAGAPLPNVRAVISPPHKAKGGAIGLCWHAVCTEDEAREVWVSSGIKDEIAVFATLVHELCHAALPDGTGHKAPFARLAKAMLLEGPPKATVHGPAFTERWAAAVEALGPVPGARFKASATEGRKPQRGVAKKNVTCPDCGFRAKIWVDQMSMGRLRCPADDEMLLTPEEGGE